MPPYRLEKTVSVLTNRGPELRVDSATPFSPQCCKLHGIANEGADFFDVVSYVHESNGILAAVEAQHYCLECFSGGTGLPKKFVKSVCPLGVLALIQLGCKTAVLTVNNESG